MPSVYTPEEIRRIEAAIDTSCSNGKRAYAMLLLATRLGLRSGDIIGLTLQELDFEAGLIHLTQHKTDTPMELPLLPEVEMALRDYIEKERGSSEKPYVFLCNIPPCVFRGSFAHGTNDGLDCLADIVSGSSTAALFDLAAGAERPKMAFNRCGAHGSDKLGDFGFRKFANLRFYGVAHGIKRRNGNELHPFFKISICRDDRSQQVFDKHGWIVFPFMPAGLRGPQGVVIALLRPSDLGFQRDILADFIPAAIEKKRRQQTRHSAVSVGERMNAEKVVDKARNDQQRIHFAFTDGKVVRIAQLAHRLRRFIRCQRRKQRIGPSVCRCCADIVLHVLEGTAEGAVGVAEHDLVKLQDIVGRQRDILEILMHCVQCVTVACDLFLVAGARRRLLAHELPQARIRRADSLDLVGGFCTLDLCNLNQLLNIGCFLPQV